MRPGEFKAIVLLSAGFSCRLKTKELTVHEWLKVYERCWIRWIGQIKQRAERKMLEQIARESQNTKDKEK